MQREGDENGLAVSATVDGRLGAGSIAAAISGSIVHLMREYTGRGPTKARTYIEEDVITVVLQDALTMGEAMITAVEQHSGRRVHAFLSDNHIDPDVAVETFVLLPRVDPAEDGPAGDARP